MLVKTLAFMSNRLYNSMLKNKIFNLSVNKLGTGFNKN